MAEWWRSWHGAPTDPKWRLIAKASGRPVAEVVAVAWALMDAASQHVTRGDVTDLDGDVLADFLGSEPEHVASILLAMKARRVIEGDRLRAWDKRQRSSSWRWSEWGAIRLRIFERDGLQCAYCGSSDGPWDIDHVMPKSRGGSDNPENLVVSCAPCNRSKRDKTPEEWQVSRAARNNSMNAHGMIADRSDGGVN